MDPPQEPPRETPDAPDQETMAQIRARRLAKLGSASASASSAQKSDNSEASSSSATSASTSNASRPAPTTSSSTPTATMMTPSSEPNPFSKLVGKPSEAPTGPPAQQRKTTHSQTPQMSAEESFEDWTSNTLAHIFRATVDPSRKTDSHGHALTLLPELAEELGSAAEPLKLTTAHIDPVIMESVLHLNPSRPILEYLYPCWKRAVRLGESVKSPQKKEVIDEARRLSLASCLFSVTMPELFGREGGRDNLVALLLGEIDRADERNDRFLFEFVGEVVRTKFDEDEANPAAFADALYIIGQQLLRLNMTEDYKPYMKALHLYTKFNPLLVAVANHEKFLIKDLRPQDIERETLLGPFFRLSPLQVDVVLRDFPGARAMDQHAVRVAQDSVKMQSRALQQELFAIANAFIRANADVRSKVLDWFAYILNTNHKRRAMRVDPREVATDGFMMNLTCVLDRLCEPFLDNNFSKIDKIQVEYLKRKPRVDISEETKLNADLKDSAAFWGESVAGESNFISEVFFLTLAAHHYGTEAVNSQYKNLDRDIKWIEKQIKTLEAEKAKITNPVHLRQAEILLAKQTAALEKTIAFRYSIQGVLLDTDMQALSLRFMRYVSVWLLRVATNTSYTPDKTVQLPLPVDAAPKEFSCLPEYALQNVVDNFKFIFRYIPQILIQATGDELITLCVTFLHTSNYIKNPYLKSSLVTILYWGTLGYTNRKGVLTDQLIGMKFANDHLLHSLMKFYIECESTGAHTQFFDKFNIRFEIFQVIKVVWVNDVYKDQLTQESEHNRSFFVRFVNLLMNDATFVLDEALGKFPKIHELEAMLEQDDKDKAMSQEDRAKQEEELQTLQNQATSYMQLANESLEMMKLFTKALVSAFTMPEIVSRLASMMNYNLETLVGPKASQLKVTNMEKYKFRPVMLVSDFVTIYLNLCSSQLFVDAVAADGRSYKPETLARAGTILEKKNMVDPEDLQRWRSTQDQFKQAKLILDQAEMDLGDIPAEFEDPIMGDLMRDPVILPSKHIVDRSTIVQHLLSDPKDPFTRQPMTEDDVIPATELKEQIEKWREGKIGAAKAKISAAAAEDAMDTTEG